MNIPLLNNGKTKELMRELAACKPGCCVLTDDGLILTEREACLRKHGREIGAIAPEDSALKEVTKPAVTVAAAA